MRVVLQLGAVSRDPVSKVVLQDTNPDGVRGVRVLGKLRHSITWAICSSSETHPLHSTSEDAVLGLVRGKVHIVVCEGTCGFCVLIGHLGGGESRRNTHADLAQVHIPKSIDLLKEPFLLVALG